MEKKQKTMVNMKLFSGVYRGKKILVTGHTGFKGSWLTLWLLQLGANVAGFSNTQKTNPYLFEILKLKKKISHHIGDISEYKQISKVVKKVQPDIIFHLAAQSLVNKSYADPINTFKTNSIGTLNILKASEKSKKLKAIVLITSDKVYKNIETNKGYKETDILMGNDPYSASKSCAEIIINMYQNSFTNNNRVKICTTRAGNDIGGGDWSKDRIIPDLFKQWSKSKILKIRNPNSTRPWQFVLEPVAAYLYLGSLLLKKNKKINFESFNIGPKRNINKSVLQLISLIKKDVKNIRFSISKDKTKKEAKLLRLNCNKIFKYTKWKPIYDFQQTVKCTADWYKNYYSKETNIIDFSIEQIKKYINFKKKNSWIKND